MPPGADFPAELVRGIRQLSKGQAPEILARSFIVVNTQRMKRRITSLFAKGPATFLPKVITLADLSLMPGAPIGQKPANTIARRIELARLIERLIGAEPDLASLDSVFDLADSLASLIDEMHGEGVSVETIQQLDCQTNPAIGRARNSLLGLPRPMSLRPICRLIRKPLKGIWSRR